VSQSLLLKIARESITEVFEAHNIIDREQLLKDYPILNEPLAAFVSIYIDKELRGESGFAQARSSLLEEIIYHAKTAAFGDKNFEPLKVSEYLHAQVQLSLLTPLTQINYLTLDDLYSKIHKNIDGVYVCLDDKNASLLPSYWPGASSVPNFLEQVFKAANLQACDLDKKPKVYTFQVETSHDEPILN